MKNLLYLSLIITCCYSPNIAAQTMQWQPMETRIDNLPNLRNIQVRISTGILRNDTIFSPATVRFDAVGKDTRSFPTVYSSVDSGKSWQQYSTSFSPDTGLYNSLTQLSIIDSLRWFSRGVNYMFKSFDAGKTWRSTKDTTSTFQQADITLIGERGYAIHYDNFMRSFDGGDTWKSFPIAKDSARFLYNYTLLDTSTIIVTRWDAYFKRYEWATRFFRSEDGGRTWSSLGFPVKGFEGDSNNRIIPHKSVFIDKNVGVMTITIDPNTDSSHSAIIKTLNGGRTWFITKELEIRDSMYNAYVVKLKGDTLMWISIVGQMLISADSGSTWTWYVKNIPQERNVTRIENIYLMNEPKFFDTKTVVACSGLRINEITRTGNFFRLVPISTTSVTNDTSGVQQIAQQPIWIERIYPMPVSDVIHLTLYVSQVGMQNIRAAIYDITGMKIKEYYRKDMNFQSNSWGVNWYDLEVRVSDVPSGIYSIVIDDFESMRSKTFIKVVP